MLDGELARAYAPIRAKSPPKTSERLVAIGFGIDESGKTPSKRLERGGPVISVATGAVVGVTSRVGGGDGNGGQLDPENAAADCAGKETRAIYTALTGAMTMPRVPRTKRARRVTPASEEKLVFGCAASPASPRARHGGGLAVALVVAVALSRRRRQARELRAPRDVHRGPP